MRGGSAACAAATAAVLAFGAGTAVADPEMSDPQVLGDPFVGETLTADFTWRGDWVAYQWYTCDVTGEACAEINGAPAAYLVRPRDVGFTLRVLGYVQEDSRFVWRYSYPTAVVASRRAQIRRPIRARSPRPPPARSAAGAADHAAGVHPARCRRERTSALLSPFPLVRIRGYLTSSGARLTLLRVKAPRGVRIKVRCHGSSCPRRKLARMTRLTRLRPYERALRAGTRIVIKVTKPGWIGKHSTILIRDGKAPRRKDRCLYPGDSDPRRCPVT